MADPTPTETTPPPTSASASAIIGWITCRIVVPLWVLTGAIFKLNELDWKLLPPPVRSTCEWIGSGLGQDPDLWLGFSMRFLIGTELLLVGLMFASTRLARPLVHEQRGRADWQARTHVDGLLAAERPATRARHGSIPIA